MALPGRVLSRLPALLGLAAIAGCVETGDFGRVKRSTWNDIVGATGSVVASARGEPVSGNAVTDDESEMRDRAWRFLVPARNRPYLDRLLAELVATRVVPADAVEPDRRAYFAGLLSEFGRSPTSAYRRLSEDAAADAVLAEPFAAVAMRVLGADRIRLGVLARTGADVEAGEAESATARVSENRCLVAWVTAASAFRLSAYRYALTHLVIEAPQTDAGPTERAIDRLASERTRLDGLGVPPLAALACLGDRSGQGIGHVSQPSRPTVPLVRKG